MNSYQDGNEIIDVKPIASTDLFPQLKELRLGYSNSTGIKWIRRKQSWRYFWAASNAMVWTEGIVSGLQCNISDKVASIKCFPLFSVALSLYKCFNVANNQINHIESCLFDGVPNLRVLSISKTTLDEE